MKTQKKKISLPIIIGLILISILSFLSYSFQQSKQQNRNFDINSLDLSDWTKSKYDLEFIFPKDNIFVSKSFLNSYTSENSIFQRNTPDTRKPIPNDKIQTEVNNQPEVKQIIKQLKKQKFKKIENLSGLYKDNNDKYPSNIYLITYQVNNIFCQIYNTFECNINGCYGLQSNFGCGQFDLEKDYQIQKKYYDIYEKSSNQKLSNTSYFNQIKEGNLYTFFNLWQLIDGQYYYIDKQGKTVCASKACCSSYTKDDPTLWGNWCTDNYQTLETYLPVGI